MLIFVFIIDLLKTIVPQYFYQSGGKSASLFAIEYMKKYWGDTVQQMSHEELKMEASTMVLLQQNCSKLATEDLSSYTVMMATILDVRRSILGCESQVLDRNDWIESLVENHSNLQIQKWLFAWMFVRSNYKKLVSNFKQPEEKFEELFLEKHGLQYNEELLKGMKKILKLV
jgi:hypothetical protein